MPQEPAAAATTASSPFYQRAFPLLPASTTKTALLLVDIQIGLNTHDTPYYGRERSNPAFETNISALLAAVRAFNARSPSTSITVIHVYHRSSRSESPLYPGKASAKIMPCAAPEGDEAVIAKTATSALVGTELEAKIREAGTQQLLICGIATDHCVSTTVRAAADLEVCVDAGGESKTTRDGVWIVDDCSACFDNHGSFDAEVVHKVNVESLRGEFCEVTLGEEVKKVMLA
ncbi:putative isochorismatase family protein [Cyphellophora attinorum]|uniref:Putative isochorismatase family protein n=1 Tax=Cyphellophora attinorum TaxID=1664694 RepID=A0A0N1P3S7_9EURO|nr:putative isochorismatase family protein [Phialophora attinorum]KPI45954.1 putative isochorismatase family protein [Phialophora attinorum]